jgi:hypothetical protein
VPKDNGRYGERKKEHENAADQTAESFAASALWSGTQWRGRNCGAADVLAAHRAKVGSLCHFAAAKFAKHIVLILRRRSRRQIAGHTIPAGVARQVSWLCVLPTTFALHSPAIFGTFGHFITQILSNCPWFKVSPTRITANPELRGVGMHTALAASLILLQRDDASAAAGCAACSGMVGFVIFIFIAIIAINIALLVWVAKDSKSRGMDNSVLWMILVMFTGVIGLVIYLLARPQGIVIACPQCNNKRLQVSAKCPHCGNA